MNSEESTPNPQDRSQADPAPHNPYATPQYEKISTEEPVSNRGCLRNVLLFSYLLFPLVALVALPIYGLEDYLGGFFFLMCIFAVPPVTLMSLIYLVALATRPSSPDGAKRKTASTLLIALVSAVLFLCWLAIVSGAYQLFTYNPGG